MNSTCIKLIHSVLLIVVLFTAAVLTRRHVYDLQTRAVEGEAPFVLEAGLQYRMTRMVYEEGVLPDHDPMVQVPEGISPAKIYSLGAEWIYSAVARVLPNEISLPERIRWASVLLFCAGIPLFAFWVGARWQSRIAAWVAGAVLVVSPAFAVRSSGLALSRENLAFPFMALFLWSECMAHRSRSRHVSVAWSFFAGCAIALAQVFWDLTQYLVGLWLLKEWWALASARRIHGAATRMVPVAVLLGLLLAGCSNPYLRAHGYYASLWVSGVAGLVCARELWICFPTKRIWSLGVGVVLAIAWSRLLPVPSGSYNHFGELLWAKIRFLNQKPLDPAELSFLQRIMWTPALNSSTFALTKSYLPLFLPMFALSAPILWMRFRSGHSSRLVHPFIYAGITLAAYVLFFRFHVFLIVFVAFGIGGFAAWGWQQSSYLLRWGTLVAIAAVTGAETRKLLFFEGQIQANMPDDKLAALQAFQSLGMKVNQPKFNAWGHPGVLYSELEALTTWMRENTEQEPVLASFGVSGSILTYAGNPILLHPKFETREIRDRVEEYAEHLFKHDEAAFRRWALDLGAVWYVHGNGSFSDHQPTLSLRYMVDAMDPGPDVAARTLEQRALEAVWFRQVYANRKYRVFRIVTDQDVEFADTMVQLALNDARAGDLDKALGRARQALRYHWKHEQAQELVKRLIAAKAERSRQ